MRKSIPVWAGAFWLIVFLREARADIALSVSDPLLGPGFIVVVCIESVVLLLLRHVVKPANDLSFSKIFVTVTIANLVTTIIGFFFPPIRHDDRDIITFTVAFFLTLILEGGIYTVLFWGSKIRIRTLFSAALIGNIVTYVCIILLIASWGPGKTIYNYDKRAKWLAEEVVHISILALKEGRKVPFDSAALVDDFTTGKFAHETFRRVEIEEIHHPSVGKLKKMIVHGDSYMPRLGLGEEDYFNVLLNVTAEYVLTVVWHNQGTKVFEINSDLNRAEAEAIHSYLVTEKDTKLPWDGLKVDETGQTFFQYKPVDRSHESESQSGFKTPTPHKGPIPKAPPGRGRIGRSPDL